MHKKAFFQGCFPTTSTNCLNSYLFEQVQHGLQLLPLSLVRPLLPEVDLGGDEGVVHDVEDVRVVRLEERNDLAEKGNVLNSSSGSEWARLNFNAW